MSAPARDVTLRAFSPPGPVGGAPHRSRGPDSAPTGVARCEANEFSARALAGRRFALVTGPSGRIGNRTVGVHVVSPLRDVLRTRPKLVPALLEFPFEQYVLRSSKPWRWLSRWGRPSGAGETPALRWMQARMGLSGAADSASAIRHPSASATRPRAPTFRRRRAAGRTWMA